MKKYKSVVGLLFKLILLNANIDQDKAKAKRYLIEIINLTKTYTDKNREISLFFGIKAKISRFKLLLSFAVHPVRELILL